MPVIRSAANATRYRSSAATTFACLWRNCPLIDKCCITHPPQTPKYSQRGTTRSGDAFKVMSVFALRTRLRLTAMVARTISPGSASSTNQDSPSCSATPQPLLARPVIEKSMVVKMVALCRRQTGLLPVGQEGIQMSFIGCSERLTDRLLFTAQGLAV